MGLLRKFQEIIPPAFNPMNYQLVDKKEYYNVVDNYNGIMKNFDEQFMESNSRPSLPLPYLDSPSGAKIPLWRLSPVRLFGMADDIGDLRVVIETIQREMFKNGAIVRPKFKFRCTVCLKEFEDKPLKKFVPMEQSEDVKNKEQFECDECGNNDPEKFDKPEPKNRAVLQALLTVFANNNNQMLVDVGRQYERDLDIIDNAYCLVTMRYFLEDLDEPDPKTGAIKDIAKKEPVEFVRLHPMQVQLLADNDGRLGYDNLRKPVWICPNYAHRDKRLEKPKCDICGCKALTGILEVNSIPYGMPVSDPKKMIYARDEILWTSGKFMPDILYGYSPIMAIWKKCMSLFHQDEYIWKYFDKDRPPKSLLIFANRNYETVKAFMERQRQGAKSDPYQPRPISLQGIDDVSKAVSFIDLTPNFKELELSELRKELRQIIATIYGVTPVFHGASSGSGLGNEGLQVTLTNRAMKFYQRIFNEEFFGQISKRIYGIYDWEIVLNDVEEVDKLREAQIDGEKIKNAQMKFSMGFQVYTDGNGEIQTSQFPDPKLQQMQGGLGANAKSGNSDKVAKPGEKQDKSTKFDGEPLKNEPSDKGGQAEGSASSGFSYSKKSQPRKFTVVRKDANTTEVVAE